MFNPISNQSHDSSPVRQDVKSTIYTLPKAGRRARSGLTGGRNRNWLREEKVLKCY
jgi:hypothetical protein